MILHLIGFVSLADIGDSLRESFFMFWETLWALILCFGLSGAVQAFVSSSACDGPLSNCQALTPQPAAGRATSSKAALPIASRRTPVPGSGYRMMVDVIERV